MWRCTTAMLFFCLVGVMHVPAQEGDVQSLLEEIVNHPLRDRGDAMEKVRAISPFPQSTVQELLTIAANDRRPGLREAALTTLGAGKCDCSVIAPTVFVALGDESSSIRRAAVEAIGDAGCADDDFKNAVLARLSDKSLGVGSAAQRTMAIYPDSEQQLFETLLEVARETGKVRVFGDTATRLFELASQIAIDETAPAFNRELALFLLNNGSSLSQAQNETREQINQTCLSEGNPGPVRFAAGYHASWLIDREQQNKLIGPAILDSKLDFYQSRAILSAGRRRLRETVPSLLEIVTQFSPDTTKFDKQGLACDMLAKMPDASVETVPALVACYESFRRQERYGHHWKRLIRTIGVIGSYPDVSLPMLRQILTDDRDPHRFAAMAPTASVMVKNALDIRPLIEFAQDALSQEDARGEVFEQLTAVLGEDGALLAEGIIAKVDSSPGYAKRDWIKAAANLGSASKELMPTIADLAVDSTYPRDYLMALTKIGVDPDTFLTIVEPMIHDDRHRRVALESIAEYGPGTQAIAPELVELIQTQNDRSRALYALGAVGSVDRPTRALIKSIADNGTSYSRTAAAIALLRLYPDQERGVVYCLSKLTRMTNDQVLMVQRWLEADLQNVVKIGLASDDEDAQLVAARLLERSPEE